MIRGNENLKNNYFGENLAYSKTKGFIEVTPPLPHNLKLGYVLPVLLGP